MAIYLFNRPIFQISQSSPSPFKSPNFFPNSPKNQTLMASENAKPLKIKDEEVDDDKSLSSLLQNKTKKPNGSGAKSLSLKDAKLKNPPPKFKKEEEDDDDDDDFTPINKLPSNLKPKKDPSATAEMKKATGSKVKKEEAGNDNMEKTPNSEVKKEKTVNSDKKQREKASEQNGKKKDDKKKVVKAEDSSVKKEKKERKVYDLPGQKRDPPEERDPLRMFYESLYKVKPESEMAAIWMMESGLLNKDLAKKLFEAKRKKSQQKLGSPMKTVVTVKKQSDMSVLVKKKVVSTEKKKRSDSKAPPSQSKKRKITDDIDGSSDEGSDNDFVISRKIKKPKAA